MITLFPCMTEAVIHLPPALHQSDGKVWVEGRSDKCEKGNEDMAEDSEGHRKVRNDSYTTTKQ